MRSVSGVGRVAAIAAVVAAALLVGIFLFGNVGGGGYSVKAEFLNAGQLVKGNLVEVAGVKAGSVKGISITPDGQAQITMGIDGKYKPLPEGTRAVIRMASQTGIANRYIELDLPGGPKRDTIPNGGRIASDQTTTAVDLDQLFNTLDPKTRKALQGFFKGSAEQFKGVTQEANVGLHYLNPALATSSRLFNELNRDTPVLEHFISDSANLVTAVAEKRDDLSALVANLNATTRAIGNEKASLADAIGRTGADNDLIDLTKTLTPLAHIAVDSDKRNGATREGAFPETSKALVGSSPIVGHGRPYTPDLFGWFDDFSTTGGYDALGSISRTQTMFNANSPDVGGVVKLPNGITLP